MKRIVLPARDLLVGEVGPIEGETLGQMFLSEAGHLGDHLPGADSGQCTACEIGGGVEIVALDAISSSHAVSVENRTQGHQFPAAVSDLETVQRGGDPRDRREPPVR